MVSKKRQRISVIRQFGVYDAQGVMVEGPFDSEPDAAEALAELAGEKVAEAGGEPIEDLGLTVEPFPKRGGRS